MNALLSDITAKLICLENFTSKQHAITENESIEYSTNEGKSYRIYHFHGVTEYYYIISYCISLVWLSHHVIHYLGMVVFVLIIFSTECL